MTDDPRYAELRQRLLALYEKKATSFATLFTAVIVFAAIFFAFVLVPYAALQRQQDNLDRRTMQLDTGIGARTVELANARASALAQHAAVEDQRRALAEVRARLEAVQGESNRLTGELQAVRARQQANTGERVQLDASRTALAQAQSALKQVDLEPAVQVDELRSFLQSLVSGWEGQELQPDAACPEPDQDRLVSCRVQIQVESQIGRVFSTLEEAVVTPFAGVDPEVANELASRLASLRHDLRKARLLDPDFWHTVSGKDLFFTNVEEEMRPVVAEIATAVQDKSQGLEAKAKELDEALAALQSEQAELAGKAQRIGRERGELDDRRAELEAESSHVAIELDKVKQKQAGLEQELQQLTVTRDQLSNQQTAIRAELDKIETRLNSIQSPFGTLPVGLSEGILAYPIFVAIGLVASGLFLTDAIRLRGALHAAWRRWDPQATILSDHHVALMAPLWFEPTGHGVRLWLRAAVFVLPALLFLTGVALIGYGWTLATPPLLGRLTQSAHVVLYLACAAGMLRMVIALRRALANYGAAVEQEARSLVSPAATVDAGYPRARKR